MKIIVHLFAGRGVDPLLGEQEKVVATLICGDNYFAEQEEKALEALSSEIDEQVLY